MIYIIIKTILCIIAGIFIGGIGVYFYLRPKIKNTQLLNKEVQQQNIDIFQKNKLLNEDNNKLLKEKLILSTEIKDLKNNISNLTSQTENTVNLMYKKSLEVMQEQLDNSAEKLSFKYKNSEKEYENEYLSLMEELSNNFQSDIKDKQEILKDLEVKIQDLKNKFSAAVEANKRAKEIEEKENFYRLQLSPQDLEEIKKLKEVSSYLRNQEPLNKVIWKVYYEKAYTDLIGRIIGKNKKTGIYKITNINNQMCYVGQAIDIASRWKQHIKRGIGAETPTKNKLYPTMMEIGVENFTFEIIEECVSNQLNEREKYWQEFFKAKEFGYSIK